jgi:hypothetical protein
LEKKSTDTQQALLAASCIDDSAHMRLELIVPRKYRNCSRTLRAKAEKRFVLEVLSSLALSSSGFFSIGRISFDGKDILSSNIFPDNFLNPCAQPCNKKDFSFKKNPT